MFYRSTTTRCFLLLNTVAAALSGGFVRAITIETVPVGDVGNPIDPLTFGGSVNYAYNIGKYEVTVGQYTSFLNAVAATDTYNLYDPKMGTDQNVAGIARNGASGSYTYSVLGSASHPITYVSWGDTVRFANWLHNGQPTGAEGSGTTETGAYTLNGATSDTALMAVTRNADATWFMPTEAEWYKAAYYQPAAQGGDSDGYWTFPTKTNSSPFSDQPPGATPDNTRVANFNHDDGIANGYDDGYAVTGSTLYSSTQNYLTDVGAYTSSPSYYGTFDQAGNALEWNETAYNSGARILRGGSFRDSNTMQSSVLTTWIAGPIPFEHPLALQDFGFRVASIPVLGDFNGDGNVDASDYVLWRKNIATASYYDLWRDNFGQSASASGPMESLAIPEPSSLFLFMVAASFLCAAMRNRRCCGAWGC